MRKIILSALVVMLLTVTATFAQQGGRNNGQRGMNPEEMVKRRTEILVKELKLSDAQTKSVQALYQAQAEERQKLMSQNQGGERPSATQREEMMKKNQESQSKLNEEIKKILNQEQLPKFDKILKEQSERGAGPGRGSNGGNRRGGSNGSN